MNNARLKLHSDLEFLCIQVTVLLVDQLFTIDTIFGSLFHFYFAL